MPSPEPEPEQEPAVVDGHLRIHEGQYPLYASHDAGSFGLVLWDAGLVLSGFLRWLDWNAIGSSGRGQLAGLRCLELGSGTGVAGLTLGRLGARVTVSDNDEEVLALLRRNVDRNGLSATVDCRRLDWADASTWSSSSFSVIVAADVLYHTDGADLAAVLQAHMGDRSVAYLGYTHREEPALHFFELLCGAGWVVERLQDGSGAAAGCNPRTQGTSLTPPLPRSSPFRVSPSR